MDTISGRLQAALDKRSGRGGVFSIVAAVQATDRSIDFVGSAGVADPQSGTAMTPDTPYFIASVTKMYTAAIIMQLHEERRIVLEAPLSEYLPASLLDGIHIYKGTDYSHRIKVRDLMAQTSGLADYESGRPKGGKSVMQRLKAGEDMAIDTETAVGITRTLPPRFAPGTSGRAHYSNTNYRLLGAIIEVVTRRPMAENYEERICSPLGLQRTYLFDWQQPRSDGAPATVFNGRQPAVVPRYLSSNVSDGGLVSTSSECLIFLRAFFEGRLFDRGLLEPMTAWNPIFFPLRYGCGLMYFKLPRFFWPRPLPEFIGHSGSTGSFAFVCPSRSMYLAGTVNQTAMPPRPFFVMIDLVRAIG